MATLILVRFFFRSTSSVLLLLVSYCIASHTLVKVHFHDNVILPCSNDKAATDGRYTYVTASGVYVVTGDYLRINNITTKYDKSTVTCYTGENLTASYTLDVSCKQLCCHCCVSSIYRSTVSRTVEVCITARSR